MAKKKNETERGWRKQKQSFVTCFPYGRSGTVMPHSYGAHFIGGEAGNHDPRNWNGIGSHNVSLGQV